MVNPDRTINVRFLRNSSFDANGNSFFTGDGYLVYGLAGPQGTLSRLKRRHGAPRRHALDGEQRHAGLDPGQRDPQQHIQRDA